MAGISDKALKTQYAQNKYRYGDFHQDSDNGFSPSQGMNGDKDEDIMNNNPNLDFYLSTPKGCLLVVRQRGGQPAGSDVLGTNFEHSKKYGPNIEGYNIDYSAIFGGPNNGPGDLKKVDANTSSKPNSKTPSSGGGTSHQASYNQYMKELLQKSLEQNKDLNFQPIMYTNKSSPD
jgi:hypothetical protein